MQNTSFRSIASQHMRRDGQAFTAKANTPAVSTRVSEACGFTRREVRALVAEMLG